MQRPTPVHKTKHKLYSLLMMVALLWLTVSTPFVYAQQQAAKQAVENNLTDSGDCDPLTNTSEEKSESGANTLQEEYLHTAHHAEQHFVTLTVHCKCHSSDLYFAFHPDTVSPPPDVA